MRILGPRLGTPAHRGRRGIGLAPGEAQADVHIFADGLLGRHERANGTSS